jgi:hypothetical protein
VIGSIGFIGGANAAPRLCDDGTRPPCDGGGGDGGGGTAPDFGDLIILYRDDNGVPIPSAEVLVEDPETGLLVDGGLCQQPIAFNVTDTLLCPASCQVITTTPATVSVGQLNCAVTAGCEGCTQEVDFGRINSARAPANVFESQLADVVVSLATADCTTLDPAGRLVASRVVDDVVSTSTIDSPLQNLAIYRQLMLTGFLGDATSPIDLPDDVLNTAARGLGVASDKGGEVNMDMVAYLNQIMGLSDATTPTILGKLCETYREEVQGTVQLVEKCFLNYRAVPPMGNAYAYRRGDNFSTTAQSLPFPAYIPTDTSYGLFEHLSWMTDTYPPNFEILQGRPITTTVFEDESGFEGGNIGGFAQAADDTRAVINFMHDWPVPDADTFAITVPCDELAGITYDVAISEESGLQVPVTYINGTTREFIVTVQNLSVSPAAATGTVTVTAETSTGASIPGFPMVFEFTDLAPGFSAAFVEPLLFDLGNSTTVTWTATAFTEFDVNPLNNTVTATTSVRNTGGGGGNGGGNRP